MLTEVRAGERFEPQAAGAWRVAVCLTSAYRYVGGERLWVFVMVAGSQVLGALTRLLGAKRPSR